MPLCYPTTITSQRLRWGLCERRTRAVMLVRSRMLAVTCVVHSAIMSMVRELRRVRVAGPASVALRPQADRCPAPTGATAIGHSACALGPALPAQVAG